MEGARRATAIQTPRAAGSFGLGQGPLQLPEAITPSLDVQDVAVMQQTVRQGRGLKWSPGFGQESGQSLTDLLVVIIVAPFW